MEKDVLCAIVTIIAGVDSGSRVFPFSVVLSRKVDCDVGWRAANLI